MDTKRHPALLDLSFEVLELLLSKSIFDSTIPDADNERENLRRTKIIAVLYDDMVLRLCKFIDDGRDTSGGPQMIRRLRGDKRVTEPQIALAEKALDRLRAAMPKLEEYRNNRVAHIGANRSTTGPHPPLLPAIREAVAFVDALVGDRNEYGDGTGGDLRVEVLGERPANAR